MESGIRGLTVTIGSIGYTAHGVGVLHTDVELSKHLVVDTTVTINFNGMRVKPIFMLAVM